MKNPIARRVIILVAVLVIIAGIIFLVRACSAPPEYSEIEARFKELIEKSHEVNVILFGEGLECYDRVYEPTLNVYTDSESGAKYYYYEIDDEKYGTIYAYKGKVGAAPNEKIVYLAGFSEKKADSEPIFTDADSEIYYYYIEYSEPEVEFYYTKADPENYSYVTDDAVCHSIAEIKAKAEKIYSENYLRGLYGPLFDGYDAVPPVFMDNASNGRLMQYNNYEPLFSEKCVYMFETAEIDEWQSNSSLVRINIKAYLPSEPKVKYDVVVDLALEGEEWYLETPTYIAK